MSPSSHGRSVFLDEITWKDAEAAIAADTLLIVPVGAVEQHGHHLPLGTDSILAQGVAVRVAERLGGLVAPTLHYTPHSRPAAGGGDKSFAGSIGIPARVLELVVRHLTEDLFRQGYRRVVFLNGHFENIAPITAALGEIMDGHPGRKAMLISWPDVITEDEWREHLPGFVGFHLEHAAGSEASCVAALRPELFDPSRAGQGGVKRFVPYDVFPAPEDIVPPTGMMGSAAQASPEVGEVLLDISVTKIVDAIQRDLQ